ncbi:MAG: hypothetical protein PVJ21_24685, partial [Anaerolineales bacterium]
NPREPSRLATLKGHKSRLSSVAFSPDGKQLASGSWDFTIILWDISVPSIPTRLVTLEGHTLPVESVAFSPDGKGLVSGGYDSTVILWDLDLQNLISAGCQRAGRNFSRTEWTQYDFTESYRKTCDQWPLEP